MGITKDTGTLKSIIKTQGEEVKMNHCKGMVGLAAEAIQHTIEEVPESGPARVQIIIG